VRARMWTRWKADSTTPMDTVDRRLKSHRTGRYAPARLDGNYAAKTQQLPRAERLSAVSLVCRPPFNLKRAKYLLQIRAGR
jgi:hypothetical protein